MVDTPKPSEHDNQSRQNLENDEALSPRLPDAASANKEQQEPKQHQYRAKKIVTALKAVGMGIVRTINWLNAKAGFVTALATIVIAILTGFYVHYSRAQWTVMRDQLPELKKSANAARDAADAAKSAATTAASGLTDSEKYFLIEQRPYMVVDEGFPQLVTPQAPTADQPIKVNVQFRNIGKTPAVQVVTTAHLMVIRGQPIANLTREEIIRARSKFISTLESAFRKLEIENKNIREELIKLKRLSCSAPL